MSASSPPLVSILMFCRDAAPRIRTAIDSVVGQTYPHIEFIVQDGGSTDGTRDILAEYGDRVDVVSRPDSGTNEAFLAALRRCRGDIVGSCLADETLRPDAVERAVRTFRARECLDALTGDAIQTDGDGRPIGTFTGRDFDLVDYLAGDACPYFVASFFRRRFLVDNGLFGDDWQKESIEFEIWTRLGTEGDVLYMPQTLGTYALHKAQESNNPISVLKNLGSRVRVFRRLFAADGFFSDFPAYAMPELLLKHLATHYNHLLEQTSDVRYLSHVFDLMRQVAATLLPHAETAPDIDGIAASPRVHADTYRRIVNAERPTGPLRYHLNTRPLKRRLADRHAARGLAGMASGVLRGLGDTQSEGEALQAALKVVWADDAHLADLQRRWVARHAPPAPRLATPLKTRTDPKRLRVGYYAITWDASYTRHQIASFVRHHSERVEAVCYGGLRVPEDVRPAFSRVADGLQNLDDAAFAERLRDDALDVLVEVNGFGDGQRFRAMAWRCAPVQASYANHAGTTGVPNVDYILADATCVPDGAERHYSETVHRLPGGFFCFHYDADRLPGVVPPPSLDGAPTTFGYFGSPVKLNPVMIGLWSRILRTVPGSRLIMGGRGLDHPDSRRHIAVKFDRLGVGADRLILHGGLPQRTILELYNRVDVSLDTWPYCGGNTIAESLWMGVPVVTLLGDRFAARYGASLLQAAGLPDLIARDRDAYVAKAVALAEDRPRLGRLRRDLRRMVVDNGFGDAPAFARKMEDAYLDMLSEKGLL